MTFAQDTTDTIRRDQLEAARALAAEEGAPVARPVIRLAARGVVHRSAVPEKKKNVLKGHEAFLKALEMNDARIEVEKKDGTVYRGVLKHTDKFTITLHVTERGTVDGDTMDAIPARDRVIFKHDMSEFSALTQRAKHADTEGNQ